MYKMYKNLNLFDAAVIAGAVVIGCFLYARKREREKKIIVHYKSEKKKTLLLKQQTKKSSSRTFDDYIIVYSLCKRSS